MRAELRRVETDAGHPFLHEPCVLPRGQTAPIAATGKQELASLPAGQPQVLVDRLARLVSELEPNGATSFLLPDRRAGGLHKSPFQLVVGAFWRGTHMRLAAAGKHRSR